MGIEDVDKQRSHGNGNVGCRLPWKSSDLVVFHYIELSHLNYREGCALNGNGVKHGAGLPILLLS